MTRTEKIVRQSVPLTDEELAELQRRTANHEASNKIFALRDELKGIGLAMDLLKVEADQSGGLALYFALDVLKIKRKERLAAIKVLEASKNKKQEGSA